VTLADAPRIRVAVEEDRGRAALWTRDAAAHAFPSVGEMRTVGRKPALRSYGTHPPDGATRGRAPRYGERVGTSLGRGYFAVQALAGAAWWLGVFTLPGVRRATLGGLDPVLVGSLDIPLFVVGSALVAAGIRGALWVVVPWTLVVTAGMALYATLTQAAGWGAVLMIASSAATVFATSLVALGRLPGERLLLGPFAFRTARGTRPAVLLAQTGLQLIVFWGLFLGVIPLAIAWCERRWRVHFPLGEAVSAAGVVVLIAATALGLWSAYAMSTRGSGTPLPSALPRRLVVAGPYRLVRNPMALAGIAQGVAVGMILGSWLVILYALCGSLIWHHLVHPHEEADLEARFGDEFRAYRSRVGVWLPRIRRAAP